MGQPYVGEIRMFAGNFNPAGWAFCNGQLLPISEFETLFNLIGTTYGGDGQETFGVPDLRGRVPIHMTSSLPIGLMAGSESVTITSQTMASHTHPFLVSTNLASTNQPGGNLLATTQASTVTAYGTDAPQVTLSPNAISLDGGSQPHENRQPTLALTYIISLFGIFPSPT
ncbi:MAG: tail fiber protein [Planctomycetota bacterium]